MEYVQSGVMWAGHFDEQLDSLITVFASVEPGPDVRSRFFDEHTVETFCNAIIKAEDAVVVPGEQSHQPTSILTEAEKEQTFSMKHSPFFGPLVGLANIATDYPPKRETIGIDLDTYIYQPLKKNWSRMIRHLWDHPARTLGDHNMFQEERLLAPHIFCRIAEVERSFASILEDDSDLTISLFSRFWVHATGESEIGQLFIFFLMLIPRRAIPGIQRSLPLVYVADGEIDTTITFLRRILQNNAFITEFIQATASHLRRFSGFEGATVAAIFEKLWNWALAFRQDPLCSEFLRVIRTSAPFWNSIFEASSRPSGEYRPRLFEQTLHYHMSTLANHIVDRDSSSEAVALAELWVSTGVFDALETSLEEVLRHGTEDDQVKLSGYAARIYRHISDGPQGSPSFTSAMRQQLPRPRTIRRLWDLSLKLADSGFNKVEPSHTARTAVLDLEASFAMPNACKRRGCGKTSAARCARCKIEYCEKPCQSRDWNDHKLVCGITMDM